MNVDFASSTKRNAPNAVIVRRPRSGDGVGSALRDAFGPKPDAMPDEWSLLIKRIDRRH
ncbi:hypothetical protein [Sphingomonas japonica]|uniref:Uncharacterized protein n=1 Tax=Sphingomonas japonica TaxID=511662 RepID=A0ABX0U1Z4_9SPHN|nr:hypothetical protein [Sphingomonas japonica]NIJ22802.1 hypothetical protein [Sphingomonas japonica]